MGPHPIFGYNEDWRAELGFPAFGEPPPTPPERLDLLPAYCAIAAARGRPC